MTRSGSTQKHKHFVLDQTKIDRAQKLLGASSEKETIDLALDEVIRERERNRQAWRAHEQFLKRVAPIRDVYGVLEETD